MWWTASDCLPVVGASPAQAASSHWRSLQPGGVQGGRDRRAAGAAGPGERRPEHELLSCGDEDEAGPSGPLRASWTPVPSPVPGAADCRASAHLCQDQEAPEQLRHPATLPSVIYWLASSPVRTAGKAVCGSSCPSASAGSTIGMLAKQPVLLSPCSDRPLLLGLSFGARPAAAPRRGAVRAPVKRWGPVAWPLSPVPILLVSSCSASCSASCSSLARSSHLYQGRASQHDPLVSPCCPLLLALCSARPGPLPWPVINPVLIPTAVIITTCCSGSICLWIGTGRGPRPDRLLEPAVVALWPCRLPAGTPDPQASSRHPGLAPSPRVLVSVCTLGVGHLMGRIRARLPIATSPSPRRSP